MTETTDESNLPAVPDSAHGFQFTPFGIVPLNDPAPVPEENQVFAAGEALERARAFRPPTPVAAVRIATRRATAHQRSAGRAPRRAVRTAKVARVDNDDGGDGPPEPPAVGPLVHQGTSGLPRRRFLRLVRDRQVPHARIGRLVVVRLDDLYRALGLSDVAPSPAPAAPAWTPEQTRLRILRGGRK